MYALIKNNKIENIIIADEEFISSIQSDWDAIVLADNNMGVGWDYIDGAAIAPVIIPPELPPLPYLHFIDIGPFYDRFGAVKMAILTSTDSGVRAIIQDLNVRKWVDLQRPDVAQALAYIGSVIPALTPAIQTQILTQPVQEFENLALRRLYF